MGLVVAVGVSFLIVSIIGGGGATTAGVSGAGSFLSPPPLLQLTTVSDNSNTPKINWIAVFGIFLVITKLV